MGKGASEVEDSLDELPGGAGPLVDLDAVLGALEQKVLDHRLKEVAVERHGGDQALQQARSE